MPSRRSASISRRKSMACSTTRSGRRRRWSRSSRSRNRAKERPPASAPKSGALRLQDAAHRRARVRRSTIGDCRDGNAARFGSAARRGQLRGHPRHLQRLAQRLHVRHDAARGEAGAADFRRGRRQHAGRPDQRQHQQERTGSGMPGSRTPAGPQIAIPLATLRFADGAEQTWGINFMRNIRRRTSRCSGRRSESIASPVSQAGSLVGLRSLQPRSRPQAQP